MIKFTPEQHDVSDHMDMEEGILLVEAGAGTGKSFMAKQVANNLNPKNGLYTAFNKAIVEEGHARFQGTNMECKTLHALAYKYVKPKGEITDISYSCIEENIPYTKKYNIITAINMFYVSASIEMYEFFEEHFIDDDDKKRMVKLCAKYVDKMVNKELNPTFNFLLKYFHLLLAHGSIKCSYDLVILDEINDTTAVALEIFKLIDAPKKLGLGETNQAIYDFLNLVNGFELLEDAPTLKLTQSFRCSTKIASDIQTFMRRDVNDKFTFVGTEDPIRNKQTLYCTLTNAKIVQEINSRLENHQGFLLLRKISDIFAAPLAITSAGTGKKVYQKQYRHLEEEYENWKENQESRPDPKYTYLQHLLDHFENDQEIKSAVNLLLYLRRQNINIFDLYKRAKDAKVDPNYTIATVYTSKGLEFETVNIAEDLNTRITNIRENGGIITHEDLVAYRCYYVACSRAGVNLNNASALDYDPEF